jgi:NAD(P)-dependent dehydrogenase (short-subunit alcohol dehydrogenase family)
VVVADVNGHAAATVADDLPSPGRRGLALDVTDESAVRAAADRIEAEIGPIDVWCSNAGRALGRWLGDDEDWTGSFRLHVMAHVYAARHVLPRMLARGRGHLLITASAAGLLTEVASAPYSVTKHGSVALAEWLAIRHGDSGVSFSCLCPQGVNTPMIAGEGAGSTALAVAGLLEPEEVAEAVVAAIREGRFLILPHPEVAEYEQRRAADRDRWLGGMRRLRTEVDRAREG